jgi:hypothetical protein
MVCKASVWQGRVLVVTAKLARSQCGRRWPTKVLWESDCSSHVVMVVTSQGSSLMATGGPSDSSAFYNEAAQFLRVMLWAASGWILEDAVSLAMASGSYDTCIGFIASNGLWRLALHSMK